MLFIIPLWLVYFYNFGNLIPFDSFYLGTKWVRRVKGASFQLLFFFSPKMNLSGSSQSLLPHLLFTLRKIMAVPLCVLSIHIYHLKIKTSFKIFFIHLNIIKLFHVNISKKIFITLFPKTNL